MIAKNSSDDYMELPREAGGTVLLSTIQAQFPTAIGLKYKSSSGGWRGIRAENNVLDPPHGGWGDTIYIITESDALKRKTDDRSDGYSKLIKSSKLLEDLIVLGLPYTTTEEELKAYFSDSCGELTFCQIKTDRTTDKSRGFGFIRFGDEESARAAIKGQHELQGRKLVVRMSQRKGDTPTKLFVGRLPTGITVEEVNEYFSTYGDLVDCFLPNPFRGFSFITYSDEEDAKRVLRMSHSLKGSRLNVTAAESKNARETLNQNKGAASNNKWNSNESPPFQQSNRMNTQFGQDTGRNQKFNQNTSHFNQNNSNFNQNTPKFNSGYDPRSVHGGQAPAQNDVVSDLKDMLLTLINNQK